MKARVKATGKIVEVKSKVITSPCTGNTILKYVDHKTGISYFKEDLFFPKDLADDPDYWTRLEHQAAIVAMQGILSNPNIAFKDIKVDTVTDVYVDNIIKIAHALVEKMKEERK